MVILGLCGSLRASSYNRRLLEVAARALPVVEVYEGLAQIPPFSEDDEPIPAPSVEALRMAIASAQGLLIATPEYNSSLPGQLKNVLDWASRPRGASCLIDKPVAVVGASVSQHGATLAQAEARKVLRSAGASVLDVEVAVGQADAAFQPDGTLRAPAIRARLADLLIQLTAMTATTGRPPDALTG